jgi:anti-sigma factor ChrR (cupin superfamily)
MQPDDDNCYCDLASLYALDILDADERRLVEAELAQFPELREELAALESTTAALAYGAPPVDLAPDVKDRLFQRLDLDPPAPIPALPQSLTVRSQDLVWQPHPTPGVAIAILHRDPVKREVSGMLRAEAGVCYPMHRHAAVEELFMLEGDLTVEGAVYGAGDYIRSEPESAHSPTTEGGCMFFFRTSMDDEYFI